MLAYDKIKKEEVAVKVFDKAIMNDWEKRCAKREQSIMSFLNHKNIMRLRNKYEEEECFYFVMDLMVDDLRNLFNDIAAPMDEDFSRKIFFDILKAVCYCHEK